jgi:O-antigen/teichoic acid export membrane protein
MARAGSNELGRAARGGAVTLVGSLCSAIFGFAFSILLAQKIGAHGAGVVLQAVGTFVIIMALVKLGLDTTSIWMLPPMVRNEPEQVRMALVGILVPAAAVPLVVSCAWFAWRIVGGYGAHGPVADAITVMAVFLPFASVMTVALAATRAFGGVVPFNAIGNVLVPGLRPVLLLVVVALGGGTIAATTSYSLPVLVGMMCALVTLLAGVHRVTRSQPHAGWVPDRPLMRRIMAYSLPRTLMSGLEQTVIWIDVVLVGVILGSTQAGIYGSASRFVSAGVVVLTALRIVVAPRFSALLAAERRTEVEELYAVTARWILLFGAPIYLLLAVFAPTVLSWLGKDFHDGASSLVILSLGSIVVLAAGNIQSLLLMSGRSGLGAFNKMIVVAFNVTSNFVLIPLIGIEGAAISWAGAMVLDTSLAAYQVRRATGIALAPQEVGMTVMWVAVCVAGPSLLIAEVFGQGTVQMIAAALVSGLVLLGYCTMDRTRLRMDELIRMGRG